MNPIWHSIIGGVVGAIIAACGTVGAANFILDGYGIAPYGGLIGGMQGADGGPRKAEIVGEDAGLAISSTNNNAGAESYVAALMRDADTSWHKVGALAWQFTNTDPSNGFASWNVHTTKIVNGTNVDDYGLAVWAGHGAQFFPYALGQQYAPGDRVLAVNGRVTTTESITVQGVKLFVDTDNALKILFPNGTVRVIGEP